MINNLTPYPAYKNSGVEWLGEIPEHWEIARFKYVLREVDSRSKTGVEQPLRVSQYTGVTEKSAVNVDEAYRRPNSFVGYRRVQSGDLAINIMLAWNGSMGVSRFEGVVSPAYCVYRFRDATEPWYFHYLIRSPTWKARIKAVSTGVVESRLRLYTDALYRLRTILPPLAEQSTIVRFLDHADRRIRRYIRSKERLIELLEEQKQAIIHQAVTGQIDVRTGQSYPAYRDSGVQWLGKVPEHWGVLPLKRAFASMEYGISDSGTDGGAIAVLTMGHIRDGKARVPKYGGVNTVVPSLLLQDKDLLFNRTNSAELVAKVGLFRSGERPATFASYLVRMRIHQRNKPEFLNLLLNDVAFLSTARREAIPSLHQSNLNPTRYGRLRIVLPPVSEQQGIAEFVAACASDIDGAVARASREIDLLNEYRTRLIADVVTGKLDVREATAAMPEELDAPTDAMETTDLENAVEMQEQVAL